MQANHVPHEQPKASADAIGVVIVTFNASDVIADCLSSLLDSDHPDLRVVVCDNASPDNTLDTIRQWAVTRSCDFLECANGDSATVRPAKVTLLRSDINVGFASGVNRGLNVLLPQSDVSLFWILNPDCVATTGAATEYARAAHTVGPFSLMGGRTLYVEPPNRIQSEGGRVSRWTGVCSGVNFGLLPEEGVTPDSETLDFIAGANFVASRAFIEEKGLMAEDYFLYYEEVDWAFRRGNLPLKICSEALVYHHGGTSIGTGSLDRLASGFANYFNYRNRMWFMQRYFPLAYPIAYIYSLLKIFKLVLQGGREEAVGAICGLNRLPPPAAVRSRLTSEAAVLAFGTNKTQ